jgi:hypothetical protein
MGDRNDQKKPSPFDEKAGEEDETIALSKDELDNILSEAEIVDENRQDAGEGAGEEDFDISDSIDELTAEDLENIELGDEDIESYTRELEEEIGQADEEPETGGEGFEEIDLDTDEGGSEEIDLGDLDEELAGESGEGSEELDLDDLDLDMEEPELAAEETGGEETGKKEPAGEEPEVGEPAAESVVDIESLDEADLDLDALIGGEEGDELQEPPVLGEDTGDLDLGDIGDLEIKEDEAPAGEADAEEVSLDALDDFSFEEEGQEPAPDAELAGEDVEPTGEEVELTSEEEDLLSSDFDLEAAGEGEGGDVVTMTGEELDGMDRGTGEEVAAEDVSPDQVSIDSSLYNDITVVLRYMDSLLGDLPEEKIKEFSQSRYYPLYKEVFERLDLA